MISPTKELDIHKRIMNGKQIPIHNLLGYFLNVRLWERWVGICDLRSDLDLFSISKDTSRSYQL